MTTNETYNIHKKINCIFPHFKSKWLCKHNKHNFQIKSRINYIPIIYTPYEPLYLETKEIKTRYVEYIKEWKTYWQCACCGKEEKFND